MIVHRVQGIYTALRLASGLITRSAWFEFTPLPDDWYEFTVKSGEGLEKFFND